MAKIVVNHFLTSDRIMHKTILFTGISGLLILLFSGCYVNLNKHIDREVRVRISQDIPTSIDNEGNSTFNEYLNEAQYKEKYLSGLKAELNGTANIVLDDVNPEFEIRLTQLTVTESTRMDTVKNTSSPDNGKAFELTKFSLVAKGTLVRLSDGVSNDWYADKNKSESFTSTRSASEIANGTNKEKNLYHEKSFVSSTAEDLTRKVGGRSGVVVVKEISRSLK
ncbi:MAG: hypothetical protein ACI9DK_003079 [Vicingaceae bacterium]|jgi:hypothetical protein